MSAPDGTGLKQQVLFITGATRGIGRAIALRAAKDGACIAVVGKTALPHAQLPGTVHDACEEIRSVGGQAIPCVADVRSEEQMAKAVEDTVAAFGRIDILVNNASAISLTDTASTEMKRFDLMQQVNARGTFMCSKLCLPAFGESANPQILTLSPPLDLRPEWFGPHVAYSLSKYGMSLCMLGLAEELKERVRVNCLWPRTLIDTAALRMIPVGSNVDRYARTPEIVADAAHAILSGAVRGTGQFFIDEAVLRKLGQTDFLHYAVDPHHAPRIDLFVAE